MGTAPVGPQFLLDREAVRAVDRESIDRYGIPGLLLMENAARGVADEVERIANTARRRNMTIWCGPGNNGGDGYAAARHLHNRGFDVTIVAVGVPRPESDAGRNRAICEAMHLPIETWAGDSSKTETTDAVLVDAVLVDALLGTGLDRDVEGAIGAAIDRINRLHDAGAAVIAVDIPSGLDADSGRPLGRAVVADATVTFVAAKPGLLAASAARHVGRLSIADIGAPRELIERHSSPTPRRRGEDAGTRS